MVTNVSRTKSERFAPLVAGVCLAIPTLVARYLPMSDLPLHEGVVGLLRHYGDPTFMPEGLYTLNLGHPNQLFHVSAALLSFVVSTSMAVKVIIATAQILMFVGGARLADHLGRSRWGALLLAPLALGFTYYWGLVANLVGFAGLLLALPTIDRATTNPTVRGALATSATLFVLFFAHESIFVSAAAIVGVFTVLRPLSPRATLLRIAPAIFAAVLAIGHLVWQSRFFTGGLVIAPVGFMSPWAKMCDLPNTLFGSYEIVEQLLLFGMSLVAVGLLLGARLRDAKDETSEPEQAKASDRLRRLRALLNRHRFEVVAALHLIAYFAVPFNWHGATLLHERFLGPAWAIFVIATAPRRDAPRLGKVVAAVVPLGILLLSWPQFVDADRTYRDLDALIERIPRGASVTLAVLDRPPYRTRVYSATTGPARIIADRGGRIGISLMTSPISPVQLRPEWRWNEYDARTTYLGSRTLMPAHDFTRFEWVVGQSRDPFTRDLIVVALSPEADLVVAKGEWLLFRSKLTVVPLKSPEGVVPPKLETALDRVYGLARQFEDKAAREKPAADPSK